MKKKLRWIFIFIFGCILAVSLFQLGKHFWEYRKGDRIYEEAKVFTVTAGEGVGKEFGSEEENPVNFDSLQAVNPDVFAWIRIADTPIDYPVLRGEDNEYYLSHAYNRQHSVYGSIFLEEAHSADMQARQTIFYGHNMMNQSMFGILTKYENQDFAEAHHTIKVYLKDEILTYEVFSAYRAYIFDPTYKKSLSDDASCRETIDFMLESSVIDMGITPQVGDRILTLSTCTPIGEKYYRFAVNAVLTEDI